MEQVLIKMARQLDALDEASLLTLWEHYAHRVANFEPSKRWEEAVLVFSLIQAKHWKNQLFNHNYSAHAKPAMFQRPEERPFAPFSLEKKPVPEHRAAVLQFKPRKDEPVVAISQDSADTDNE